MKEIAAVASPPNGTGLLSKPQSIPIPAPVSISSEKWKDGKKQYPCSYPILTPAAPVNKGGKTVRLFPTAVLMLFILKSP